MSIANTVEPELNASIALPSMTEPRKRRESGDSTERVNQLEAVVRYVLYIVITLFLFVPFVMTVLSSFKTSAEVIAFPPTFLPSVWHPENYLNVLTQINGFPRMVFNSFFVTLMVVALNLFFDSLVGYAFARLDFPFKNTLFAIMIATMVIPGFVFIVPRYIMLLNAHLVDTYFAFMVLYFVQPAYILLMTQFLKIILPLARPALLATGILTFAGMWNNFLDWIIYMQSPNMQNIQLGLVTFRGAYQNQWNLIMAGSVLAILPILIVYIAGQRYFVRGIATTGMK